MFLICHVNLSITCLNGKEAYGWKSHILSQHTAKFVWFKYGVSEIKRFSFLTESRLPSD